MASAWGRSWASAWGNSWGSIIPAATSNPGGGGGGSGKRLDESVWDEVIRYARRAGTLEPDAEVPEEVVAAIEQIRDDVAPTRRRTDFTQARAALAEIRALLRGAEMRERQRLAQMAREAKEREAALDDEDAILLLMH